MVINKQKWSYGNKCHIQTVNDNAVGIWLRNDLVLLSLCEGNPTVTVDCQLSWGLRFSLLWASINGWTVELPAEKVSENVVFKMTAICPGGWVKLALCQLRSVWVWGSSYRLLSMVHARIHKAQVGPWISLDLLSPRASLQDRIVLVIKSWSEANTCCV